MKPSRVLITGGSGFLGNAIASTLLKETAAAVSILDPRLPSELIAGFGQRVEHLDITLEEFLSKPEIGHRFDVVVHLTWTTIPASPAKDAELDVSSNILLSIRLLHRCGEMGVSRFVFASSGGTVYGPTSHMQVDENFPTNPICAYGISKLAVEKYASLIGSTNGFCSISLRVANPFGHFQLRGHPIGSIARFLLAVHQGQPITLYGDGSVVRDYLSIDDVADAFILAINEPGLAAGAYNIGSGIGRSLNDIIRIIAEITDRDTPIVSLPHRPFDVPRIVLDSSRYRHQTGWVARRPLDREIVNMWRLLNN